MARSQLPDGVEEATVKRVMERVLRAEQDKLHMDLPRGINDEIQAVIEDEVD